MIDAELAASPWEQLYQGYVSTWTLADRAQAFDRRTAFVRQARGLFARAYRRDAWWARHALADTNRQSFVVEVMDSNVPRHLFAAMIQAAVREPDAFKKRQFIKPCMFSYGQCHVIEALLVYLERGADEEKAEAAIALYWASSSEDGGYFSVTGRVFDKKASRWTPEAQAEYASWQPVRTRQAALLTEEFRRHENSVVRQFIVAQLFLNPTYDEQTLRALGPTGLEIARRHDNWYVRRRARLLHDAVIDVEMRD